MRILCSAVVVLMSALCLAAGSALAATPTPTGSPTPVATTRTAAATAAPNATPPPAGSMTIRGRVPVPVGSRVTVEALNPEKIRAVSCASTNSTGPDSSKPSEFVVVVGPECVRPPGSPTLRVCWASGACSVLTFQVGDVDVGLLPIPTNTTQPNPGASESIPTAASGSSPRPRALPGTGTSFAANGSSSPSFQIAGVLGLIGVLAASLGVRAMRHRPS